MEQATESTEQPPGSAGPGSNEGKRKRLRSKPKPPVPFQRPRYELGTPVFAINLFKYFPHQLGASMIKRGYMQNYYYEPFKISRIILIRGVYKYGIASYTDNREIKYYFYEDQLQQINPQHAADYIRAYRRNAAHIADSEE
jgi:hypothetical protein